MSRPFSPQFCTFPAQMDQDDPYLAAVAADFGLGNRRPGLILTEQAGNLEVLVSPDGRIAVLPVNVVRVGLPENAALALMDVVEEAIEDAVEAEPLDSALVTRLETTLDLLERCLAGLEAENKG
ncbi:MAG TPA: hypothetical protein VNL35_21370 [Chloroflexota bacterium]|nr:hypothetical protein [Chloroflexota bacterium]